jgi:hypothetical protein
MINDGEKKKFLMPSQEAEDFPQAHFLMEKGNDSERLSSSFSILPFT